MTGEGRTHSPGMEPDCCDAPDLGPMETGGDGSIIATARRCRNCGVVFIDVLDVEAPDV